METLSSDFAKDIKIIISAMDNKAEIPPPEPVNPYPPHVPYAPAELLEKEKEKEKEKQKESDIQEDNEYVDEESLEETSKEIEMKKEIEAYKKQEEREIEKEIEKENNLNEKIERNCKNINKAIRNKAIEIMEKEFELENLNKERDLLRKKRVLMEDVKEYKKIKAKIMEEQKIRDDCQPYEEEEEEDDAYERERIKRDVFRFQKALEIRAYEKKLEQIKTKVKKTEKELAKEENSIELKKAQHIEYQEQMKKEIEEEDAGKWPGEPRWGMLYL